MIYIILIFALVLRLINLNQSLWLDEAVQAITAQNRFSYIFQEIVGDFHPPLYHFLIHYWVRIFGSSEVALRMPSVLFGIGAVYVLYLIINELSGAKINGLIGAIFLATAPFHIYYSQETRTYSMTAFFASTSMFYFIKIVLDNKKGLLSESSKFKIKNAKLQFKVKNFDYLWYLLATLCLLYSDYFGFLVLLAQGTFLLIKKKYKLLLISNCILLIAYFPWLPMFITQIKTGMLATETLPEWGNLVNVSFLKAIPLTLVKFTIGRITIFDKRLYTAVSGVILFFIGSLMIRWIIKGRKSPITNHQSQITLWFFVPLIVSWLASLFIPNFQPFRLLLILPAFYLILAVGIHGENASMIQIIEAGIILAINLSSLLVYYSNPYFHREDWRGVVKYLGEQSNPTAILPSETSDWPIRYYDPLKKIQLIYGTGGFNTVLINELRIDELTNYELRMSEDSNKKTIYYIRYLVPLFDPKENILAELNNAGYTKVREISFNQIPVWEFKMVTGD